jgi:hypothetical protein
MRKRSGQEGGRHSRGLTLRLPLAGAARLMRRRSGAQRLPYRRRRPEAHAQVHSTVRGAGNDWGGSPGSEAVRKAQVHPPFRSFRSAEAEKLLTPHSTHPTAYLCRPGGGSGVSHPG